MRKLMGVASVVFALAACSKEKTYEAGGTTDTTQGVAIDVGLKKDTMSVPTLGTVKDTIIVDRPVLGRKPVEIKRPTVDVKKKP
jgi:hypothetical protein